MSEQLELLMREQTALAEMADQFLHVLSSVATDRFLSRRDMAAYGFSSRECRACCEHLGDRVISGQNGYKLTRHATVEEISACANAYMSQARKMVRKAVALKRIAHGRVG